MPDPTTTDTSTEVVEQLATFQESGAGGLPDIETAEVLRALAAERDALRSQLERATDPAYLTEALAKIGAVDPQDHAAAIARAEAAETEREALVEVARATSRFIIELRGAGGFSPAAFHKMDDALDALPPGLLEKAG